MYGGAPFWGCLFFIPLLREYLLFACLIPRSTHKTDLRTAADAISPHCPEPPAIPAHRHHHPAAARRSGYRGGRPARIAKLHRRRGGGGRDHEHHLLALRLFPGQHHQPQRHGPRQRCGEEDKATSLIRPFCLAGGVGLGIILLQGAIWSAIIAIINPAAEVREQASIYFHIMIWGAPLVLLNYELIGLAHGTGADQGHALHPGVRQCPQYGAGHRLCLGPGLECGRGGRRPV